ncbi:MAG: ricin-type beta-trefoil lectin domain protein [Gemmatimonadaceae bacterium]
MRAFPAALAALLALAACSDSADPTGPAAGATAPQLTLVSGTGTSGPFTNQLDPSRCLTVQDGSTAAGARLISQTCNGGANQQFAWQANGEIRVYGDPGMCLAAGVAGQDGDPIVIWWCNGNTDQRWTATTAGEIKGINGKCLAAGQSRENDPIVLWSCNLNADQRWDNGQSAPLPPPPLAPTGEAAGSADAFVNSVGVVTKLNSLDLVYGTGYASIIRPKLLSLGVRHIRDGLNVWPTVAARYRELGGLGIRLTGITEPKNGNYDDASHILPQADAIGSALEAFEGANEPEFWGWYWADQGRRFQRAVYNTVKGSATWGATPVLQTSVSGFGAPAALGDLSAYADFGNLHPYPGGEQPTNLFQSYLDTWVTLNGSDPPQATETGYHNYTGNPGWQPGVTERAAARYVPRMVLQYFNAGIVRTFLYELIDQRANPTLDEDNFGLLRNNGTEKPAFAALRNLLTLLADPGPAFTPGRLSYTLTGDLTNVSRTLLQKRDGRLYMVLWQEVSSYSTGARTDLTVAERTLTLTLGAPARQVTTYRPVDSASPSSQAANVQTVTLRVPDHPLIIEITP